MSGFVPDEVGSSFGLQLGEASPISDWEDLEEEEVGEGPGGAFELSCNVCSFQPKFTVRACPVSLVSEEGVSLFSSDTVLPALDIQESRRHKITTCECLISHTTCRWCKSLVGYKVVEACQECLAGDNNGHYFMFSSPTFDVQDRVGEPSLQWLGGWSVGEHQDTYQNSIKSSQTERIAEEEDFRCRAVVKSQELYGDLVRISQCRTHANGTKERLMTIFSHFQQHPDLAICSKLQFVQTCRDVMRTVKTCTELEVWDKQMAASFGQALVAFKGAENFALGARSEVEATNVVVEDESLWWAARN